MLRLLFLIPVLPLAGFSVLLIGGRRIGNPAAGWIATAMVGASFVVTVIVFAGLFREPPTGRSFTQTWFTWISAGSLHVPMALLADPLSLTMAAFVTGVSTLIHLYSIGYMSHDEDYPKFFLYLNLFVFSMLMLVLANNFLLSFLGWEGVGVCSYLLISFWFERDSAASAGKKAMIFNRIGDAAFLVALFLIFERTGSLTYQVVFARLGSIDPASMVAIGVLLFAGAAGKSAQLPLFPWLADAMEGPTPVSALIHAATMVTAGVYLMCRIAPILHAAPDAAHVVAIVGASTAFVGATSACAQQDIKKALAYSTISQLGYMFLAAGVGAYDAAIFLMVMHAFYKALLFLCAGSVIHAMNDNQDLKSMGALARAMPITGMAFLVGWLAIGGIPPLSGFWAKGEVLTNAYAFSPALWAVGAATAVLTAYYVGRVYFLTFKGDQRWDETKEPAHPHDAPWVMTIPLVVLSVLAALGGLADLPFAPTWDFLSRWLAPVFGSNLLVPGTGTGAKWAFAGLDTALAAVGVGLAWSLWRATVDRPAVEPGFLLRAWFVDAAYDRFLARPSERAAELTSTVVETEVIDGAVNGFAGAIRAGSRQLRKVQTGYVRNYALGIAAGVVLLLAYMVARTS